MKLFFFFSKILFASLFYLLASTLSLAQITPSDYVTTWKTDNSGSSSSNQITIPASGEYTVYYESIPAGVSGTLPETGTFTNNQTLTFPQAGTYRIAIKPTGATPFHRINFQVTGDQGKLLTVEQWGTTAWYSMEYAYSDCGALTTLPETDVPDLSNVTSLSRAFLSCTSLTGSSNMNNWDVSNLTSMYRMFDGAASFNQPVGNWDVSNVTDMRNMFEGAASFNQPIGNWNVSNVTNMRAMFDGAASFNQPIGNWDVSNVTNMMNMFNNATVFNQPLNRWNVSNVETFQSTFRRAAAFNQSLSNWTLNAYVNMFYFMDNTAMDCGNYNSTLIGWAANPATPSNVYFGAEGIIYGPPAADARNTLINSKSWIFEDDSFDAGCTSLISSAHFVTIWKTDNAGATDDNQILIPALGFDYNIAWEEIGDPANHGAEIGSYNHTLTFPSPGTYQVSITPGSGSFIGMSFFGTQVDNQKLLEIKQWGDIRWESMSGSYPGCTNLTITATDIPDLQLITSTANMFSECSALSSIPGINSWNVSSVTDMSSMFSGTTLFNDAISSWDVSNVTNMMGMFEGSGFNQPIGNWNVGNVTSMSYMFSNAINFNQPIGSWNVSSVTSMISMFYNAASFNQSIADWDVSQITNMSGMFNSAISFNQPLDDWEVGQVTDMNSMFGSAASFNQPLENWDVSQVTNMSNMFSDATMFNGAIGSWKVGNVVNMGNMFYEASAFNQAVGLWNVSNVTDMRGIFTGAKSFNQPIGSWDVSQVTSLLAMFEGAVMFNQPIGNWNVSNVTSTYLMFGGAASFNQPVHDWDVSKVTDMSFMFRGAESFNQPVNNWDVSQVAGMYNMFDGASGFNQSLGNWTISADNNMTDMLAGSGMDCANMARTLQGWAQNPATPDNMEFGADGITYGLPAAAALETLKTTKGWTITIGDGVVCDALPVSLIRFDAKSIDGTVKLEWATASETDHDYFEVERSDNARNWNAIGRAEGAGTVTSVRNYSLTDLNPLEGISYYRLKIVDNAGKADYSNVRAVNRKKAPALSVYPNPASDILLIENYQQVKQIEMFNASGLKLLENEKVTAQGIDISRFLPGLHTVKIIHTDGTFQTTKVLILR